MGEYDFVTDLKILPLSSYDLIVGMDWLEMFNPMKVHWAHKWISIPFNGTSILLQGITDKTPIELLVHISSLSLLCDQQSLPALCPVPEV